MQTQIQDIAYQLPERTLTNDELNSRFPDWDMEIVEERAGVVSRHIAEDDETAYDLGRKACLSLLEKHPHLREKVDCLLFCTQSPDYIMPPNSCVLHKALGLSQQAFTMDFNLACSGFVYGLTLADSFIASGRAKHVLLVTGDTYSKYIHHEDRSARTLFGDGAAVTWLAASESPEGIQSIKCGTSGEDYDKFIIPAGGCRQPRSEDTQQPVSDQSGCVRTLEHIHMDGMGILTFVNSTVSRHIKSFLKEEKLTFDDIDLCIFHQASSMALDALQRLLRIPPEKVFRNFRYIGNTVSASIPIAFKDAQDQGLLTPGKKVLICGFGVGLSWGSAIIDT